MKNGSTYIEDQIRKAIKKGRFTAYRLSKETGIHHSIIVRFVNKERSLSLATASKLIEALGLELVAKKSKKTRGKQKR